MKFFFLCEGYKRSKKKEFSVLKNEFFSRCAHKFIPSCDNPGTTGIGLWLTFTSIKMWNLYIYIYLFMNYFLPGLPVIQ